MKVVFVSKDIEVEAEFNNSQTAQKVFDSLPLRGKINWWKEEIYFYVSLKISPKDLTENVEIGDIAYWPEGPCICIFLGRTPISTDDKPKPASSVAIIGKVEEKYFPLFKKLKSGQIIEVNKDGSD